jgi:hypothetical protein
MSEKRCLQLWATLQSQHVIMNERQTQLCYSAVFWHEKIKYYPLSSTSTLEANLSLKSATQVAHALLFYEKLEH